MMRILSDVLISGALLFSCAGGLRLEARVLRVPAEHATIGSAVSSARDGDTILVGVGVYIEENIRVDRRLRITAASPYGAVIYGPEEGGAPVFSVTADAEIDGFVIKNGGCGIEVRSQADALLTAHDLVILNMADAGISVDAQEGNLGEAVISDVIMDHCLAGLRTNDARGISAKRILISNCHFAFAGFDHLHFRVDRFQIWNCAFRFNPDSPPPVPPATNRIDLGEEVLFPNRVPEAGVMKSPPSGPPGAGAEEGRKFNILGNIFLSMKEYERAGAAFRNALELARPEGPDTAELLWEAQYGLGRTHEARGDLASALSRYRLSVDAIQVLIRNLPPRADKADFFLDKLGVFEDLIGLLVRMHRRNPGRGHDREAFQCAEKARTNGFMGFLRETGLDPEKAPAPEMRRSNSALMALSNSNPGDIDRLLAGSSDGRTALVEYVVGERASFAFCVFPGGLSVAVLPPAKDLDPLIGRYLKLVRLEDGGTFHGSQGGRRLYDLLLGPFSEALADMRKIIVVPDGRLFLLPFEALVRRGEGAGSVRFLVEDYEISYAPSAGCLLELSGRRSPRPHAVDLVAVACDGPSPPMPGLPPLVHARREVGEISGFFAAGRRKVLSGDGATEGAVKMTELRGTRFIHFAAHGVLDPERWTRSALLLRAGAEGREDGFLQPSDISTLELDAEMVVLSACRTAEGKLVRGEGVLGLSAAFLAAGARSVLSSLWEVPDRSTAGLMKDLYAALARGMGGAEALRLAKIAAIRSRHGHPRRWAGFVLTGADGAYGAPSGATVKNRWPDEMRRPSSSKASTSQ